MKKRAFCLLSLIIGFLLAACTPKAQQPYFTDRTIGWEPSFDFVSYMDGGTLQEDDFYPVFYCFLFQDSKLTSEAALPESDMTHEQIMEYGLKLAFENRYIDIGEDEISIKDHVLNGLRIYDAGSTRVILDTKNNTILQCVDARLQPQFVGTKQVESTGEIAYHIDLAQLTAEEIRICNKYLVPTMEGGTYRYEQTDLPLTPQKAFQVTADDIYNSYGNSPGSIGCGEYKVYDCKKSNSWLICGMRFTQMLDKDTGDRLLLMWGMQDLSVERATQESVRGRLA